MFIRVAGKVYGPYEDTQIRQFVAEGRLVPTSDVSHDSQSWFLASQVPGLFTPSSALPQPGAPAADFNNPYATPYNSVPASYEAGNVTDPNISFWDAYKHCWKTQTLRGRARRKEIWAWSVYNMLFCFIPFILLCIGAGISEGDPSSTVGPIIAGISVLALIVFALCTIATGICVQVRRLHDMNLSGWCFFLSFVPYLGGLIMLVFDCVDGTVGPNQYGPDPKARA